MAPVGWAPSIGQRAPDVWLLVVVAVPGAHLDGIPELLTAAREVLEPETQGRA
jgi:hypothetical protein